VDVVVKAEIVHFVETEIVADFSKVVDMVMVVVVAAFEKNGLIVIDIHQIVFVAVDVVEIGIEKVHIVGMAGIVLVEIVEIKVETN
jgi:hypothetical protein